MLDSMKGRMFAALAMVACCGTAMAIALGLVVFTSTWAVAGAAAAVIAGCVLFAVRMGHGHTRDAGRSSTA